jgi:hypothetical protein
MTTPDPQTSQVTSTRELVALQPVQDYPSAAADAAVPRPVVTGTRDFVYAPAGPSRRFRLVVGIAVALLLAITSTSAALSFRNGRAWERRAGSQAARADRAERQAELLGSQLDASEAKVGDLQQRMTDLADEKAQVEDQREVMRLYAKRYQEVTKAAGAVTAELTTCISELADAMSALADPYASTSYLDQAVADCRRALDDSQALQTLIDGMPAPPSA